MQELNDAAIAAADFGAAADAVDEAAAKFLGVNRTDLRLLGVIRQTGAPSAGELAAAVGLSPSSTTTAIQRLVRVGHVERRNNGNDRRRAVVTLTPGAAHLLERIYSPIAAKGRRELSRYSADELALLTEFLRRGRQLQVDWAARVNAGL